MQIHPLIAIDSYKLGHMVMYPENIANIYVNMTPRSLRHFSKLIPEGFNYDNKIVAFGMDMAFKEVLHNWQTQFFDKPFDYSWEIFSKTVPPFIGDAEDYLANTKTVLKCLHSLGSLPLVIKTLPEGSLIPVKTPVLTIRLKDGIDKMLKWLPTYLETQVSQNTWKPMTAATVVRLYRKIFEYWADKTCDDHSHVMFQGHNFADRGLAGTEDAIGCGIAHLTQSNGSDSVHSVYAAQAIFNYSSPFFAASVPATEHSVMQLNIKAANERETIKAIIKAYPKGIVSVVSDTEDYWKVISETLPSLKDEILARQPDSQGLCKYVVRPDSGDPVDVICGTASYPEFTDQDELDDWLTESEELDGTIFKFNEKYYQITGFNEFLREYSSHSTYYDFEGQMSSRQCTIEELKIDPTTPQAKGTIELLWDTFGGTINSKGYKVLNPKIGCIYGDSITPARAHEICKRLEAKGFASSNIIFGIGSYSLGFHSRDTLGLAIKATAAWTDKGELIPVQKTVITDPTKVSAIGLLHVDENFNLKVNVTPKEEATGMLKPYTPQPLDFEEIRARARA